jgi:serine/threonine-protein kinase HipA
MRLDVRFKDLPMGLLNDSTGRLLFQYDASFLRAGIEPSPFYLPLQQGVIAPDAPFECRLPGLFADSLPDYWGRTIMDRRLREAGMDPAAVSVLKRLAMIGDGGFGALSYHPAESEDACEVRSLQEAVHFSQDVLETTGMELPGSAILQQAGSNPGGRFPKLCVGWHPEAEKLVIGTTVLPDGYVPALLKLDLGEAMPQQKTGLCRAEYEMLQMAGLAGIRVPTSRLLEGEDGCAHLLVERFDRRDGRRVHLHSFSGLAHKLPVRYGASYEELLRVVSALTHDQREVDEMFRRMVFNVLCGNRDDHVRNHAFLMDGDGRWRLSPAFDLTPTPEIPEHSLSINGKWSVITEADLESVGTLFSVLHIGDVIERCRACSAER